VADYDLPEVGVLSLMLELRARGVACPWIVPTRTERVSEARAVLNVLPRVATYDGALPPDAVLFLANELSRDDLQDLRVSRRELWGTGVRVVTAGGAIDGYTYNVCEQGMFVRTLHPVERGEPAVVALAAPGGAIVRLSARVAWQRPFGPLAAAVAPAGIGLEILPGRDAATYASACEWLSRSRSCVGAAAPYVAS